MTTDHISPAGAIKKDSPAGKYPDGSWRATARFQQYGSRRGNDRVMTRGTFANIRLKNLLAPGTKGASPTIRQARYSTERSDAHLRCQHEISGGQNSAGGAGRQRLRHGLQPRLGGEGRYLLGVKAVIAESFERIHRSNLVGMGVLPLQYVKGANSHEPGTDGRGDV